MAKFKDYDALAAEKESFGFRVGGKDFELPADLPAKLVLDIRRSTQGEMSDEEAEDFGFRLIEQIIGKENWSHVVSHIGIEGLGSLVSDMLAHYGLAESDEGGDPKAETQKTESPSTTSSNTGQSSTPTSSAFGLIPGGLSTPMSFPGPASSVG